MKKNEIITIPNILSMLRIAIIPFIIWAFCVEQYWLSAGLILFSGLTDVIDGYIARHFNMISPLGKALDPIADKLTLISLIIMLCLKNTTLLYLLVIFIIKELIMAIEGILIIKKTGTTYNSRWHGKITTLFLYFTMIVHVVWISIPLTVSAILLVICAILMIMTLTLYTIQNVKVLKKTKSIT